MTTVVRYITASSDAVTPSTLDSTGKDYQLVVLDLKVTNEIAPGDADETYPLFHWKGSGTIKSIASILIKVDNTQGFYLPIQAVLSATAAETVGGVSNVLIATNNLAALNVQDMENVQFLLDNSGTILSIKMPQGGKGISTNSTFCFQLVIGNY